MVDVKTCLDNAQEKMDMAIMYLEEALAHIRAGKASARLLDGIRVDSYGSMVPISNVAAITTPDARSIVIKPWDKSMFRVIEKAIIDSDLGIMPVKDGLAEDEQKNAEAKLQKIHDKYIKQIDDMLAEKDKEIMTV